ncbi:MAG: hypothetical protein IKL00_00310 [Oscillospiraceae bacterium]|nr:hypothetical protein [Oscillospiraceae bacterium]
MDKNIRILMGTKRRRHSDGSFHLRKHKLWQMTLTVGILPSAGRCSHVRKGSFQTDTSFNYIRMYI